ncbi:hypothetical protein MTYM_02205 [Methylococcales bacterium]|nr:hypothetical protein MTYM_02205 [Methylococcales bacterium]
MALEPIGKAGCLHWAKIGKERGFTLDEAVFLLSNHEPITPLKPKECTKPILRLRECLFEFRKSKHPDLCIEPSEQEISAYKAAMGQYKYVMREYGEKRGSELIDTPKSLKPATYLNLTIQVFQEAAEFAKDYLEDNPRILELFDNNNKDNSIDIAEQKTIDCSGTTQKRREHVLSYWLDKQKSNNPSFDHLHITESREYVWKELMKLNGELFKYQDFTRVEYPETVKKFFGKQKLCVIPVGRK